MADKDDIRSGTGPEPKPHRQAREERLAAALRENLRRRKDQARRRAEDGQKEEQDGS